MKKVLFFAVWIVATTQAAAQVNMPVLGKSPDTAYIKVSEVAPDVLRITFDPRSNVEALSFQFFIGSFTEQPFGEKFKLSPAVLVWEHGGDEIITVDQDFRVWGSQNSEGKFGYYLNFSNKYGNTYIWVAANKKRPPAPLR